MTQARTTLGIGSQTKAELLKAFTMEDDKNSAVASSAVKYIRNNN